MFVFIASLLVFYLGFLYIFIIKICLWVCSLWSGHPIDKNDDIGVEDFFRGIRNIIKISNLKKILHRIHTPMNTLTKDMVLFASILDIFAPLLILGYQFYVYLKTGYWQTLSIIDVMQYYEISWALSPGDWYELWNILNMINISVPVFIIGICIALVAF